MDGELAPGPLCDPLADEGAGTKEIVDFGHQFLCAKLAGHWQHQTVLTVVEDAPANTEDVALFESLYPGISPSSPTRDGPI